MTLSLDEDLAPAIAERLRGSEYSVIADGLMRLTRSDPDGLGPYDVVFLTSR